jgi:hypothetical protein
MPLAALRASSLSWERPVPPTAMSVAATKTLDQTAEGTA